MSADLYPVERHVADALVSFWGAHDADFTAEVARVAVAAVAEWLATNHPDHLDRPDGKIGRLSPEPTWDDAVAALRGGDA